MQYLATRSPLDELLDGGLEGDAITLVFGEGGSGKTNLALQCAREAALAGKRIAYVDTEGVSSVRLRQVFEAAAEASEDLGLELRPDGAFGGGADAARQAGTADGGGLVATDGGAGTASDGEDPTLTDAGRAGLGAPLVQAQPGGRAAGVAGVALASEVSSRLAALHPTVGTLMDRVLFFTPFTIEEQERLVQNATRVPNLGLVVVDSINMHYRLHIDAGEGAESEASRSLYKQLHHLTGFARQHQVPILVTGQVYGGEDTTQPFARRVMEHLVKGIVRFEKRPDGARRATVIKHRSIEEGRQAYFRIGRHGLEEA